MSRVPHQPDHTNPSPAFLLHKEGYSIKDYRLIARIGEGSFGQVWKAERGGFEVALKILKASVNSDETQRELKSLETLKKLHHRYLLHTENFWSDGDQLYIEMELADGGTLKDRFKACLAEGRAGIPEDELLKYFTEAAKALDYLHGHRPVFLHRDIKPANVLLVKGCAKLGDFGLLRQVTGDNSSTQTQGGTIPYMAPESIKEDKFSISTDMFSFAVMYAELRQGSLPFMGNNQFQICERIMKESPKLTDIFDPEERKVLLKALSKAPEDRFASCGEFVFELNRVVPWLPAVTVPTSSASGSGVPDTHNAKTTDSQAPKADNHGTSRRTSPKTMQEVDLPDEGPPAPGAATTPKVDRTLPGGTKNAPAAKPAVPPVDHGTKAAASTGTGKINPHATVATPTSTPTPKPKPMPTHVPIRKKKANAALPALLLLVILGGVFTGVWFVLNQGERTAVRHAIDDEQYAKAFQHINNTSWLLLPRQDELIKNVEHKWWASIKAIAVEDHPERLPAFVSKLKEFHDAFPEHAEAKARLAKIEQGASNSVLAQLDTLLKIGRIADAQALVASNRDSLKDQAKTLLAKIAKKQEVLNLLDTAEVEWKKNEFDTCLATLKTVEPLIEHDEDRTATKILQNKATAGAEARNMAHEKLVAEFVKFNKARDTKLAQAKANEILAFRTEHPRREAYQPAKLAVDSSVPPELLIAAWKPLHADNVNAAEARKAIEPALQQKNKHAQDVPFQKNLTALTALVAAHEANAPDWQAAVKALVQVQRDPEQPSDLSMEFWPALVKLETSRKMFGLNDLKELQDALPAKNLPKQVSESNAQLISLVLERLVKESPYPWYPAKAELPALVPMLAKINGPSNPLAILRAECLLRQDAPLAEINAVKFAKTDWYGGYVAALAKEKQAAVNRDDADRVEAANLVAEHLEGKTADIKPSERAAKAVDVIRIALKTLDRKGEEFTQEDEAKNAVVWLTAVLPLIQQNQDATKTVDDLVNLAFAALKTLDRKALERSSKVLGDRNRGDSATLRGYTLITEAALKLSQTLSAKKKTTEAIAASKLCQKIALQMRDLDLKTATDLYSKAVDVYALIEFAKNKKNEDYYQVFAQAAESMPMQAFYLPLVAKKLDFSPKVSDRLKALGECEKALDSAKKAAQAETDKDKQEWWRKLRCTVILKVADVRYGILEERRAKKDVDKARDEPEYRATIKWFQEAKNLDQYAFRPPGEISFFIGNCFYALVPNDPMGAGQKAEALRDAQAGQQEFRAALKAFEAVPEAQRTDVHKHKLAACRSGEKELTELVKKWESN